MTWKQIVVLGIGAGCIATGAAIPAASNLLPVGTGLIGWVMPAPYGAKKKK